MMEDFFVNMAIASLGLLVGGAVFLSIMNWLGDEFLTMLEMELGDWIGVAIFFGVAAILASVM